MAQLDSQAQNEAAKAESLGQRQLVPLGNTGLFIPALGYGIGTAWYKTKDVARGKRLETCIKEALDSGYIHIDEAEMYENEKWLKSALEEWLKSDPKQNVRENIFITGKIMRVDKGVERVCRNSLKKTALTYYDLYLIHAPFKKNAMPFKASLQEVWRQMETLVDKGLVRSIGVSNFRSQDIQEILEYCRIRPCCNQIECHPYLQQHELRKFCSEQNITVVSFGCLVPLTKLKHGPVDTVIGSIATRIKRTPVQILMRWTLQIGTIVVSTTSKGPRMKEYIQIFDFELSKEDIDAITLAGGSRPEKRTFWSNKKLDLLWSSTLRTGLYFMRKFYLKIPGFLPLKN